MTIDDLRVSDLIETDKCERVIDIDGRYYVLVQGGGMWGPYSKK